MAMDQFTQAYKKARKVFQTQTFASGDPDWEKFLKTELGVISLLGETGPDPKFAAGVDKLRAKIGEALPKGFFQRLFSGEADIIWNAAGASTQGDQAQRAAAIKFIRHLYRATKRGAQDVWVFNPPKAHKKYIFDEMSGSGSKAKLNKVDEMFGLDEMRHMSAALAIALAASQKTAMKLSTPDDAVKQKVKDWFCPDHGSDPQFDLAMKTLKRGVPKVVNACNSNSLVFSDSPTDRKGRSSTYGLAVPGGEGGGFPVIYLEGAFTRLTGNSGKMWLCAQTIVHELTHVELSTKDHFYDYQGLKPSSNFFPQSKALGNADSWGYFVIDVDGKLSDADRQRILVSPGG